MEEKLTDCTKCHGDCCYNTVLTDEEGRSRKYEMFMGFGPDLDRPRWFLKMAEDGKCVYLNRETWKCNIYEDRPEICRTQVFCEEKNDTI